MFIQTEATPNPATLKFLPGKEVLREGTADFRDADSAAAASPLAGRLLTIPGVTGVFFGYDFVTVTKDGARLAASEAGHPRRDHGAFHVRRAGHGRAARSTTSSPISPTSSTTRPTRRSSSPSRNCSRRASARRWRRTAATSPSAASRTARCSCNMKGACAGCPSSTATLKHGIQNLLKHFVPEVQQVEQIA